MDGRDHNINTRLSGLESHMMDHILQHQCVRETWQNYFQIKVIQVVIFYFHSSSSDAALFSFPAVLTV